MDIVLKGKMDGIGTAQQIRSQLDIPIIYLTAYPDDRTFQRAKLTEPFAYILKPFEEQALQNAIEMALYKHKMEKQLKEREEWYHTILRSIGDAVITTDSNGIITFINPVTETLTGWKQEKALGKKLPEVFNIENGKEDFSGKRNMTLLTKDGAKKPIFETVSPIQDNRGNSIGSVVIFQDISGRREAEETLQRNEKELKKKVKELEDFYDIAIGRELRIIELKKEIDRLGIELKKYKSFQKEADTDISVIE
jgi:PAS domain S-box-containing protein